MLINDCITMPYFSLVATFDSLTFWGATPFYSLAVFEEISLLFVIESPKAGLQLAIRLACFVYYSNISRHNIFTWNYFVAVITNMQLYYYHITKFSTG